MPRSVPNRRRDSGCRQFRSGCHGARLGCGRVGVAEAAERRGFARHRSVVIFAFQGNRNPFIDHPEWVACVFEGECGE